MKNDRTAATFGLGSDLLMPKGHDATCGAALQPALIERLHNSLLGWYAVSQRDLPWRSARDPYAVWISEVMAQQTRIASLLPYYRRFMSRFPTVQSLAGACADDLLKVWEGLGYYARAKNLQKAAQKIIADYGGQPPRT